MQTKHLVTRFDLKQVSDEDPDFIFFEGYASTFNNADVVNDIIAQGAFSESLSVKKANNELIPLLWQHHSIEPIGVLSEVFEDSLGLFVRGKMPRADTNVSGRVYPQLKVGSINSMSIGFQMLDSEDQEDGTRLIKKVNLWEVSLVTFPANPKAKVSSFSKKAMARLEQAKISDEEKARVLANIDSYIEKLDASSEKDNVVTMQDLAGLESIATRKEFEAILSKSGKFSRSARVWLASFFQPKSHDMRSESASKEQSESAIEEKGVDIFDKCKNLLKQLETQNDQTSING